MSGQNPSDDWHLLNEASDPFHGLETLFERHKDYVFRVAWGVLGERELAEDVTQEVFLRLAKGRRRWRPRARLRTLLYRIALNTCREIQRARGRDARLASDEVAREETVPAPDPRLADLARALDVLSQRQREAVVLRFFEGLDTRETAKVMGCRQGTVKSHLHRAIEALRRAMEAEETAAGQPLVQGLRTT